MASWLAEFGGGSLHTLELQFPDKSLAMEGRPIRQFLIFLGKSDLIALDNRTLADGSAAFDAINSVAASGHMYGLLRAVSRNPGLYKRGQTGLSGHGKPFSADAIRNAIF